MARGRFISNAIMGDKKINGLSDDTSRLAFTWLITEADCEGRVHGDPAMVRSLIFPRRDDITIERMEAYINEWHEVELIRWYRANGDLWIWFPNFEKYQVGLRKEREPASQIPPLSDGELMPTLRKIDGELPEDIRQASGTNKVKRSKAKLREHGAENAPRPRDALFDAIAEVCKVDPATAGSTIGKVKSALIKAVPPYTPEEVLRFGESWPAWKDKPPTVWQLKEQIGIVRQNGNGNTTRHAKEPEYTPEELARAARINAERAARKEAGHV